MQPHPEVVGVGHQHRDVAEDATQPIVVGNCNHQALHGLPKLTLKHQCADTE